MEAEGLSGELAAPVVVAEGMIAGQVGSITLQTAQGELLSEPPNEPEDDECLMCGAHASNLRMPPLAGGNSDAIASPSASRSGRGTPAVVDPTQPLPAPLSGSDSSLPADPNPPGGGPEADFVLFRNAQMPDAGATFRTSDTGEPSIGTFRNTVFQTGNWYAAVSGDNGASYRYVNPFTTFPVTGAFAGGFCCDQRVAQDANRGLTLWYLQYLRTAMNTTGTNGVRVAAASGVNNLLDNSWIYADFTPASFGLPAQDRWLDFPNMEVTPNFVYMTSNVFNIAGANQGSVMWRISLNELAAGGSINYTYWNTTGTIALANGAGTTMFGGSTLTLNSVRMYRQNEADGNLSFVDIGGLFNTYSGTHNVQSPDGNNWTAFADERMQTVWVSGNEVGMMWNSAAGGNRPQSFIRCVRINHTNNGVINQPDVWDPNFAVHYPDMAVNSRGHVSGVYWDGNATNAPSMVVMLDDDLNGDPFNEGWESWVVASGTNAGAGRWGDYTGAARDDQFGNTWLGGGYVLQGAANPGTDNDNNDVRAAWWGRGRDNPQILPAYGDIGDTIGTHGPLLTSPGTFTTYNALWSPAANRADVDMYSVLGYAGSTLTAGTFLPTTGSTEMDTMIRVFDQNGIEVAFDDDLGPNLYSSVTYTFATSGFYYIGVSGYNNRNYSPFAASSGVGGSTGDFGLTVTLTPPPDVGDTITTALIADVNPGNFGLSYIEDLGNGPWGALDVDFYSFDAVWGEPVYTWTSWPFDDADTYMRVFNASGQQILADDDSGTDLDSELIFNAPYTGRYHIGISGYPNSAYNPFFAPSGVAANTPGQYDMFIDTDATSDAGDDLGTAWFLLNGIGSYGLYGSIGNWPQLGRDVDLYSFSANMGQRLTTYTDYPGAPTTSMDTVLRLLDQFGNQLAVDDDSGAGNYSQISDYALPYTGTYYVGVSGYSNFGYNPLVAGSGTVGALGDYLLSVTLAADVVSPRTGTVILAQNPAFALDGFFVPVGSGDQLRSIDIVGANALTVVFSENMQIDLADLTLTGDAQGVLAPNGFAYDSDYRAATWHFAAPLAPDRYTILLNADGASPIRDLAGNSLDGEWDNPTDLLDPTSSTVSGNGIPGGDFSFRFTVLPGDANGDNMITGADYTIWADNYGLWNGDAYIGVGDFNGDGFVTGADYTVWADLYGTDLTGPSPADGQAPPTVILAPPRRSIRLDQQQAAPILSSGGGGSSVVRRARMASVVDEVLSEWSSRFELPLGQN